MKRRRMLLILLGFVLVAFAVIPVVRRLFYFFRKPNLQMLHDSKQLVADLVDTIIPATDSVGAREAGVADFVIGKVEFFLGNQAQHTFIRGLVDLEKLMMERYGKPFGACTPGQRENTLNFLEQKELGFHPLVAKIKTRFLGYAFIDYVKAYTIEGYFNSEAGATTCLRYLPVPIDYVSCVEIGTMDRSWATK